MDEPDRLLMPLRGADPDRRPPPDLDLARLEGDPGQGAVPVIVTGGAGRSLLAFSSVDAARRWRPRVRFIVAPRSGVISVARRAGATEVVVDIAGPVRTRIPLDPERDGDPATSFGIRGTSGPLSRPAALGLRALARSFPAIEKIWVLEADVDDTEVLVVALEMEEGARPAADAFAARAASLFTGEGWEGVQFVVLSDDELGRAARAAELPLYEA